MRRTAGVGPSFPITGYDELTAAQVQTRLGTLTPAELRKVRDYERRSGKRKTVLQAIESKLKLAAPLASDAMRGRQPHVRAPAPSSS